MITKLTAITPEYMKHRIEEETEQYKQEIERLHSIIKEAREYIDKWKFEAGGNGACMNYDDIEDLLEILDKEK